MEQDGHSNGRNTELEKALVAHGVKGDRAQEDFARSIGIHGRTLRRWIYESVTPQPYWRERVAKKLKVKAEELWPRV